MNPSVFGSTDAARMQQYINARVGLVTNGRGDLAGTSWGEAYNFEAFTPDPLYAFAGARGFVAEHNVLPSGYEVTGTIAHGTRLMREFIAIDPSATYRGSEYCRTVAGTNRPHYFGVMQYDADLNEILSHHTAHYSNTRTTLAAPLSVGDTTITVASAANWKVTGLYYEKIPVLYGYKNSYGFQYPDYTYSRYTMYLGGNGAWLNGNISGNVITLASPWTHANPAGGAWPVGTAISNGFAGSTYNYAFANGASPTAAWTNYSGTIGGIDTSGNNSNANFRPGISFAKLFWLPVYQGSAGDKQAISCVSFAQV